MPDERMALIELIEKQADTDLVREMLSYAAERIMVSVLRVTEHDPWFQPW